MIKNKPIREAGQDPRAVPTYSIPEAATQLAIHQRTLFSWYEGAEPVLRASAMVGLVHLLSYQDIEEAYRVYLLRERYHYSLQSLRLSMARARSLFGTHHPLQRADAIKTCFGDLVYDEPARPGTPRVITSLLMSPGQQFVDEVIDLFGKRVAADGFLYPWRFASIDEESRPVSMNPEVMSGRLVVVGTRIPVSALAEGRRSGQSDLELARDYDLVPEQVEKALTHIGLRPKAA